MSEHALVRPRASHSIATFIKKYPLLCCIVLIVAVGLIIRLVVLPFATSDGGDSAARVWIAWSWLSNPSMMPNDVWGPLHFYMIGPVIWLFSDTVNAPVALHVVFGVLAPDLMYFFVRVEFSNHRTALLAALTFAVYPILVRNSVSVRAEAPFIAFMLAQMVFLALARKASGAWHHAFLAGIFLTLAGMLRYEAWMLIPLFALVLWRQWRLAGIFIGASMVFPTI